MDVEVESKTRSLMGRSPQKSLVEEAPLLADEWHPTLNGALTPRDVASRSSKAAWWRCSKDPSHEWRTSIAHRTRLGSRCPFCVGKRVSSTNSLSATDPQVASEWHPTRNGALTPDDVLGGSARKAWWRCPLDPSHVWCAKICNRVARGQGCPRCQHGPGSRPRLSRALAKEWHPEKNGALKPSDVTMGSHRTVWWRCRRNPEHDWQASIRDRVEGTRCPYCINRRTDDENCLARTHPEIAAEWHATKNDLLTPFDVVAGSGHLVWWKCANGDDHEWAQHVYVRTGVSPACPFCVNQRVSITNALSATHPKLAREWHDWRNGELRPDDLVGGSNRSVWWRCAKGPDHEWRGVVAARAKRGIGCPFCSNQRVSMTNSLAARFPALAAEWHPTKNKRLTPSDVVYASNRKVWWRCAAGPDHEWATAISHRTANKSGCPFCWGRRASVTNSLASLAPDLAREWHPKRNRSLTPHDVTCGSAKRVWWKCPRGPDHEWDTPVNKRGLRGDSCPFCSGRRASVTNSLGSLFPEIAREWHGTKNGSVTPDLVLAAAKDSYWWLCPRRHAWRGSVRDRTIRSRHCPICATGSG
jgi:hypothetical protein